MSIAALNDTWVDCIESYKALVATMKPWAVNCPPHIDSEILLSAPEIMDAKTDTGYNWSKTGPVDALFAPGCTNPPRDVSALSNDEIVELLDSFFVKEALYIRGVHVAQTMLSFVYFHKMDLLRQKSPLLYAYARCVIRTLVLIIQHVSVANVRDEEENIPLPVEIRPELEVSTEEMLAELEIFARQTTDARIKSRLMFRVHFMHLLNQAQLAPTSRTNAGKWFEIARVATESLEAIKRSDLPAEPTVDKTLFRHEESICWLTLLTVHKEHPVPLFADALSVFRSTVTQLHSLSQLLEVQDFQHVTMFLESFALKAPNLTTRSIALQFLIRDRVQDSFLCRQSLTQWLWRQLTQQYGAPIYGLICDGDDATLRDVVAFRASKTLKPLEASDPKVLAKIREETVRAIRGWGEMICGQMQQMWRSMLCNQGRCHRRLTNMLDNFMELQHSTLEIESHVLCSYVTGLSKITEEESQMHIQRASLLTNIVLDLTAQVMHSIVSWTIHLQLLTAPEFVPAHWLLSHLSSLRQEAASKMYLNMLKPLPLPNQPRGNKKTAPTINPLLTMRQATSPSRTLTLALGVQRTIAEMMIHTGTAMDMKHLMTLTLPATSLVTPATIFNNRFQALIRFQRLGIPPYQYIVAKLKMMFEFGNDEEKKTAAVGQIIPAVVQTAKRCADETKAFVAASKELVGFETEYYQAAERTTRSLSATLSMLQAMDEATVKKFQLQFEAPYRPFLMTLTMKRLPQ